MGWEMRINIDHLGLWILVVLLLIALAALVISGSHP